MDRDAEQLQKLGYAQQLLRDMGGFANFALSFSIISVLTGAVTLYGHGLKFGGPIQMFLGWPLVTLFTLAIAASLAELASAYPTAGALYHWSALLGGRGAGFFTAWLNTIGQFAITAGIDYGLAEFLAAPEAEADRHHDVGLAGPDPVARRCDRLGAGGAGDADAGGRPARAGPDSSPPSASTPIGPRRAPRSEIFTRGAVSRRMPRPNTRLRCG